MENFGSFAKAQLRKLYNQVQDVSSMVSHTIIQHQKPSPNLAEVVLTVYIDCVHRYKSILCILSKSRLSKIYIYSIIKN